MQRMKAQPISTISWAHSLIFLNSINLFRIVRLNLRRAQETGILPDIKGRAHVCIYVVALYISVIISILLEIIYRRRLVTCGIYNTDIPLD